MSIIIIIIIIINLFIFHVLIQLCQKVIPNQQRLLIYTVNIHYTVINIIEKQNKPWQPYKFTVINIIEKQNKPEPKQ